MTSGDLVAIDTVEIDTGRLTGTRYDYVLLANKARMADGLPFRDIGGRYVCNESLYYHELRDITDEEWARIQKYQEER